MAAADKLIPTATLIANNIRGTKYSTSGTYKLPAKKATKYQNPVQDAYQFFSSIYAKVQKVANSNETWNFEMVTQPLIPKNVQALYTPNRNVHSLDLSMIVAISEPEWNELNYAVSKAINIISPKFVFQKGKNLFNTNIGLFKNHTSLTADLKAYDGTLLGTFDQGKKYANAWNKLKVPYDKNIGITTEFIAPLLYPLFHEEELIPNYWYRKTGIRHWEYPFTGYDTI